MRNNKGQFQKGHNEGIRFGSGQSFGSKDKYKKISEVQKGRKLTQKHIEKLRGKRPIQTGILNHNWKGGVSTENDKLRHNSDMKLFRKSCLERDNYICQISKKSGGELVVHHINNFAEFTELRSSIENGITLSKEVHLAFHKKYGKKNNTKEQLVEFAKVFIVVQNA